MSELIVALVAAAATSGTWWIARRKTKAEAESISVATATDVVSLVRSITEKELARTMTERDRALERITLLERRVDRLEDQIRSLGHTPVNGETI